MKEGFIYTVFLCAAAWPSFSQKIPLPAGDYSGAKKIQINQEYSFPSPAGYGKIQEFKPNPLRSPIFFKEERNTIWFIIDIPYSGILTFDISPENINDDYDWMLFLQNPSFLQSLQKETLKPVRSNNSRNDLKIKSATGLKESYTLDFTPPGPNPSWSKPLEVKKGQRYILVVDNIYEKGKGFKINLKVQPTFSGALTTVQGVVKNRNNQPLQAELLFEDDSTAFPILKSKTDKNGFYRVQLPANRPINSNASNPEYLFATEDFKLKPGEVKKLNFTLDTIARGNKLILFNVHFKPNKDELTPVSEPELQRLLAFLKKEPNWNIRIIGHTNNNVFADARYLQKLSFSRAVAVKRFLTQNGISEKRISCMGLGGKSPLTQTKDVEEGMKNMRVEIVLEKTYHKTGAIIQ